MKTIKARVEQLETFLEPMRFVIVPSWGKYVYIDGKQVPKAEYSNDPEAVIINLTWDDDEG